MEINIFEDSVKSIHHTEYAYSILPSIHPSIHQDTALNIVIITVQWKEAVVLHFPPHLLPSNTSSNHSPYTEGKNKGREKTYLDVKRTSWQVRKPELQVFKRIKHLPKRQKKKVKKKAKERQKAKQKGNDRNGIWNALVVSPSPFPNKPPMMRASLLSPPYAVIAHHYNPTIPTYLLHLWTKPKLNAQIA